MLKISSIFILSTFLSLASSSYAQNLDGVKPPTAKEIKALAAKLASQQQKFEATSWSSNHPKEKLQTFDNFIARTVRPNPKLNTIYIQQIGDLTKSQEKVIDAVCEFLQVFFNSPVKRLDPVGLNAIPQNARRTHPQWGDKQILTSYVLNNILLPKRPKDAIAVLGLTTSDLWPGEGWNFVFGQASLVERVGIWSLYRYGNPDTDEASYLKFLLRALKVALHETGHMYGIEHCISFRCCMNGSNSLPETDDAPLAFCSECSAKIWYRTGVDPNEWFEKLAKLAGKYELKKEAEYWKKSAELLGK